MEAAGEMPAGDLQGSTHPLVRATRRFEIACLQLLSALAFLAAIVLFVHGSARRAELAAGIVMCVIVSVLATARWSSRRQCALDVIRAGDEDLPLDELESARRRLHDPRRRAQMASSLERCLQSAERWHQTAPQFRPVANVRLLLPFRDDVREIQRLLCADALPRVRGVALCGWLLTDGATSPLYRSDGDAVRRELGRIRFALDAR
jgi:hypothetical protein